MAVYSTNQVRQLYVANAFKEATADGGAATLVDAGDVILKSLGDIEKEIYFEVQGPETVLKSDRIPVKSIKYIKAVKAEDMAKGMRKVLVALDPNVNGGAPIAGQDYVFRINLRQFYGMSDQDQYFKDTAVHASTGMTAEQFYEALAKALNLCFSREVGATTTSNPYFTFTASADGLTIEEKPQRWTLGTESQERVYFDVVPTTVYDGIDDVIWGVVTEQEPTTIVGNGKDIADLEYFLLGERGDQYRKIGWPNDIETKGLVDPTKDYNVLEIHYTFNDTGVNSYSTEKDITIVSPTAAVINSIVSAINTATGFSVAALA